jgi:4-amino-4-deoxy-L-arabinose transferase-like glycosyltransferase
LKHRGHAIALAVILAGSFFLKLHHLSHESIKPLDEVFHAIVARNFLKHPLTPTLVDQPYLPYDDSNWQANHIWLHKPPMALWQIAFSFALLGINTLALRLPSAVLSTAAVWLTYRIGADLLDRTAGLIAAALQAFNPVILMLVHGYLFSDHVDISLLFWTELSIWFLLRAARNGKKLDATLCGIAQGLAFLSKSFPALIVAAIAVMIWLMPRTPLRLSSKSLLTILIATAAIVLPWMFYVDIRFHDEFVYEQSAIVSHLDTDVEGWAAPWDRLAFDYCIGVFHVFYPAVLAAMLIGTFRAVRQKETGPWIILLWALAVFVPNLMATSKTVSATLIGWPALWLMFGYLISRAISGDRFALGTWLAAMLLAATTLTVKSIPTQGWGYGPPGFASIMRQNSWVIWHVLAAIFLGMALKYLPQRFSIIVATTVAVLLAVRWWPGDHPRGYGLVAWEVTQIDKETPNFIAIGKFAHKLPPNAAFIVDEKIKLENKLLEFTADRSCSPLGKQGWPAIALALIHAGAVPYLVSSDAQPLPAVFVDSTSSRTVYACTAQAVVH